jgi:hypothetical protein
MDEPKPTREDLDAARDALEAALESAGLGEPGAMDRVKLLKRAWEEADKRFRDDSDA